MKGFEFNYPDKVALIDEGGTRITYEEIDAFCAKMSVLIHPSKPYLPTMHKHARFSLWLSIISEK